MAQISEITIKELGLDSRLDAEYYQPFYLRSISAVESTKGAPLSSLGKFIIGPFGSTVKIEDYVDHSNSRYIRGKDVKNFFINDSDNVYVPDEKFSKLKQFHIKVNDLLITVVGTLGNVSVVTPDVGNAIFSCKSTIFRPNEILPGYLCVYLNTKYGQGLLIRNERGAVQTGFNLKDLENILVPNFGTDFEKKINSAYFEAHGLRQKSKSLYAQAEKLLLQELGLENFTPEWVAGYETDFDNILEVARMDAEYFQPRYELLMEKIGNANKIEKLGDISTLSKKKVNILPEETYKYIEIGDVDTSNGEFTYNEIAGVDLPANAKKSIHDESLLISTVRPTRGAVGVIPNGWNNGFVVSGAFAVFEKHSISPFYLQVVMRSIIGKMQLERRCTGVSYPTVTDEDVANVVIPLLDDEKIKKIHDLVTESHKSLHESRQLLEQAKREVEEMIETKAVTNEE